VALPTDVIPLFYSGSVNIGSVNSQSLAPSITPTLLISHGGKINNKDKRFWQKFDNIFLISGLTEFVGYAEHITRNITRKIQVETSSISDGIGLHFLYSKSLSETTSIMEGTAGFTEYFTAGFQGVRAPLRKFIPKIATEIKSITDSISIHFSSQAVHLNETVTSSDSISRTAHAVRGIVEGICSLLFNGLSTS
jgi:hypothetical protein